MNCLEFRRRIDTDPNDRDREFLEHKAQCGDCAILAVRVSRFQAVLNGAVKFGTPENIPSRILLKQSFATAVIPVSRRKVLALAACVIGAVGGGFFGTRLLNRQSEFAREVFALIEAAPYALAPNIPLKNELIVKALAPVGLLVKGKIGGVTFAGRCLLKNRMAGHLVLQGSVAPITVFAVPGVRISSRESIRGGSLHGELLPHGSGTLAIVGAHDEKLEAVRETIRTSLVFGSA